MEQIGAIYIRVSTDKQEELSPAAQLRLLEEYAEKHNIHIPKEYIFQDDGISGRKAEKRPAFQRMIALAKSKEHPLDCILVWKFSRFARNQEESILYKSLLRKNNVDVISISENTTGEFGTLIERIIEWMDEYYSIRLSDEVIRGMTENALRGNQQSAPPIGYLSSSNGLPPVIDEDKIIIPLTMKKMFDEGKNTLQIARYCNEQGWRTARGNLYEGRTVKYILCNPFYAGYVRWNYSDRGRKLKNESEVIIAKGKHPAVWSYDDYLVMKAFFDSRRNNNPRNVSTCKHWLSGLIICSSCGHSLSYNGLQKNPGWQCWAYGKAFCSVSHYINNSLLEKYVIDGLKNMLQEDNLSYEIIRTVSDDVNSRIEELNRALSRLTLKEERAKTAYLEGIDTKEEYKKNKDSILLERERITELLKELTEVTINEDEKQNLDQIMIKNISDVISILEDENADYETKGNAIRSIIDKITFDRQNTAFDFSLCLQL